MKLILGVFQGLRVNLAFWLWKSQIRVHNFGALSSGKRVAVVEVWLWSTRAGWMMGGDGWSWVVHLVVELGRGLG